VKEVLYHRANCPIFKSSQRQTDRAAHSTIAKRRDDLSHFLRCDQQVAVIKQHYQANDWDRVEKSFQADPSAVGLLVEAEPHIRRVFGEGVEVLLDMTPDASGSDHPFLYARIWAGEARLEVSRKLRRFDERWWLDAGKGDAWLESAITTQPFEEAAVAI